MGARAERSPLEANFRLILGAWDELQKAASQVRFAVFVEEQNVPVDMELDEFDTVSDHAVIFDDQGQALATGRLLPDGHIGRMAVMSSARGSGLGAQVLLALIGLARQKSKAKVMLSAQLHAIGFYQRYGFVEEGEIYVDCAIEHKDMYLVLS